MVKNNKFVNVFNFQDPITPVAEGIIDLHNYIIFYLIIVLVFVIAILIDLFIQNYEVYKSKKNSNIFFKSKTRLKLSQGFNLKPRYSSFFPLFAIAGFALLVVVTQKPTIFLEIASLVTHVTENQSANTGVHNKLLSREFSHSSVKGSVAEFEKPVIHSDSKLHESSMSFTKSEMEDLQRFVDNVEQLSELPILPTDLKMDNSFISGLSPVLTYQPDYFFIPYEFSEVLDDLVCLEYECLGGSFGASNSIIDRKPANPLFLYDHFGSIDRVLSKCVDPAVIDRLPWNEYSQACEDWVCGLSNPTVLWSNRLFYSELLSIVNSIDVGCFDPVLQPGIVSNFSTLHAELVVELDLLIHRTSELCDAFPETLEYGYSKYKPGQLFRLKFNLDNLHTFAFQYYSASQFCEEWDFFFSALQKDQPVVYSTFRTQPRITDVIYGGELSEIVKVYGGVTTDYTDKINSLTATVGTDIDIIVSRHKKTLLFYSLMYWFGFTT